MYSCLGAVYGLAPDAIAKLSYGQIQGYLSRVGVMQKMQGDAVANGLVPIVTAMFAR